MRRIRFPYPIFALALLLHLSPSAWAWSDAEWEWAGQDYGLTLFTKTINGCVDGKEAKVLVKVVNTKDFPLIAEFRVTNSTWSQNVKLEIPAQAADSSTKIVQNKRTCRVMVDRIRAYPVQEGSAKPKKDFEAGKE